MQNKNHKKNLKKHSFRIFVFSLNYLNVQRKRVKHSNCLSEVSSGIINTILQMLVRLGSRCSSNHDKASPELVFIRLVGSIQRNQTTKACKIIIMFSLWFLRIFGVIITSKETINCRYIMRHRICVLRPIKLR